MYLDMKIWGSLLLFQDLTAQTLCEQILQSFYIVNERYQVGISTCFTYIVREQRKKFASHISFGESSSHLYDNFVTER